MSAGAQLARGAVWSAASRYSLTLTQLVTTAILSRMLDPGDFGVVGMITVITGFIHLLADAGVGSAVIQRDDLTHATVSGIFWLNGAISGALALVFAMAAPAVAAFYGQPELLGISRAISATLLLSGIMVVPIGIMRKQLRFKEIALAEIGAALASAAVAVVLAYRGAGFWALVVQTLVGAVLRAVLLWVRSGWRPALGFAGLRGAASTLRYAGNVAGFNSINYWARNADNLLVGRYLGPSALGFYAMAYSLMMFPLKVLTGVIDPVLHPVLARIQHDVDQVRRSYLRVVQTIAYLSVPLALGMWAAARPLILTVWGPGWEPVIPVFRILAVLAAVQPIVSTSGAVFMARNRTRALLSIGSVNSAVMVLGIVLGLRWGITGVAWGYAAAYSLIAFPTMYFVVCRLLRGTMLTLLRHLVLPAVAGLAVVLAETGVLRLTASQRPGVQLVSAALAAAVVLAGFLWGFHRNHLLQILNRRREAV